MQRRQENEIRSRAARNDWAAASQKVLNRIAPGRRPVGHEYVLTEERGQVHFLPDGADW
jgi:hypothetical protein